MKLSEAIRLGAIATGKANGVFFTEDSTRTCAQGAALYALGYRENTSIRDCHKLMGELWPWTREQYAICPVSECVTNGKYETKADYLIAHLNNNGLGEHGWTRERIADWVSTIEPQDTVEPEPVAMDAEVMR